MAKAILLIRVSTQQQDLDQQTKAVMQEAFKEGFIENDLIIIEEKESAIKLSEEERRGLNRMKAEIAADQSITHVFIYELSRLSRRQLVLFSIRDFLISKNIQLVCCTPYFKLLENGKMSQTANLMFSIFASMAESEMELKKERLMRGRMHNKANGKNFGHPLLYGYSQIEDKTITIDEEKAEVVRWIFYTYADEAISLGEVAKKCFYTWPGEQDTFYTKRRMSQILNNKAYIGTSEYPAIINEELFIRCNEKAEHNRSSARHTGWNEALLKRIIFDDRGRHMTYSHCKRERYMPVDGTPSISRDAIDNNVWELSKMLYENYVANKEKIQGELDDEKAKYINEKLAVEIKKRKLSERIDLVEERVIYGRLSKDKAEKMQAEIMKETDALTMQIKHIDEKIAKVDKLIADIREAKPVDYDSFDTGQKIALIRQMIEKVVISKPCRAMAVAKVFPKVGSFMYELEINVMTKEASMTSRMRLDDVKKSTK